MAAVATSLIAVRAVIDRSDRLDQLTDDLETVSDERDEPATELARVETSAAGLASNVEQHEAGSAAIESRWLAVVCGERRS